LSSFLPPGVPPFPLTSSSRIMSVLHNSYHLASALVLTYIVMGV
jgi:hypothetical protein